MLWRDFAESVGIFGGKIEFGNRDGGIDLIVDEVAEDAARTTFGGFGDLKLPEDVCASVEPLGDLDLGIGAWVESFGVVACDFFSVEGFGDGGGDDGRGVGGETHAKIINCEGHLSFGGAEWWGDRGERITFFGSGEFVDFFRKVSRPLLLFVVRGLGDILAVDIELGASSVGRNDESDFLAGTGAFLRDGDHDVGAPESGEFVDGFGFLGFDLLK